MDGQTSVIAIGLANSVASSFLTALGLVLQQSAARRVGGGVTGGGPSKVGAPRHQWRVITI